MTLSNKEEPDRWMFHMRNGDFEKAWEISDKALALRAGKPYWHLPRHFQHIWDGSPLEQKRVLVRCYHGLGDTIQFIRYAPLVKATAASLAVWCQAPLIPLLQSVPGIDQLLPLHDGTPDADFDVDVEIMELAHIFRTTPETIPAVIPYLLVEPMQLPRSKDKLAVGLVWKAGDWDERRSIPFSLLTSLASVNNCTFYILQSNALAAGWNQQFGIYRGEFNIFDYARVISGLDLLITVDSMPAHLAGALGVPVWTLLHADPDWRWMKDIDTSPWYPTMRLFRQEQADEWQPVIEQVATYLQKLVYLPR